MNKNDLDTLVKAYMVLKDLDTESDHINARAFGAMVDLCYIITHLSDE